MTDAELAILSLLTEGPNYDHTLNELIVRRGLRRWTAIGVSSLYFVLDKLEKQGLIIKHVESDGRRLFSISPAGTGVVQTAIVDLLSTPHAHDKSFELGLVNLHVLKSSQVRTALQNRQQDIVSGLSRLRASLDDEKAHADAFQTTALFSHRIRMLEAELDWLNTFFEMWNAQAKPDPELVIEPAIIPRSRQVILPQDSDSIHKAETTEVPSHRQPTVIQNRTPLNNPSSKDEEKTRPDKPNDGSGNS